MKEIRESEKKKTSVESYELNGRVHGDILMLIRASNNQGLAGFQIVKQAKTNYLSERDINKSQKALNDKC